MIRLRLLIATLGIWAISGCAGTSGMSSPVSVVGSSEIGTSSLIRGSQAVDNVAGDIEEASHDTRLYVTNWNNSFTFPPATPAPIANSVSVFDVAHRSAPLPPIAVGNQLSPSYMVIDRAGKLYLSNVAAQSVTVFDTRHGNAQLPSITGLASAEGIAIDRRGKLFVSNGAQIDVFDTLHANASLPSIPLNNNASVIALDRRGKLYVDGGVGQIDVFDTEHGNVSLPPIFFGQHNGGSITSAPFIEGLLVGSSGELYAATSENSILVFDTQQSKTQLPAITGDSTFGPAGMAEDRRGRLYVANARFGSVNQIMVFDITHGNVVLGTITGNGMEGVNSVALR